MSNPNIQPTAHDIVQQALVAGISPEALIAAAQESMRKITPIASATATQAKEFATPLVGFADAAKLLKEQANFDLEKAREQAVQDHTQWGIVQALQKKGLIKDAGAYGALFDQATMSETGLAQFAEQLKQGRLQLPLFDSGLLNDQELFHILIEQAGIPFWNDSYGYKNLGQTRTIDPSQIPNLEKLNRQTPYETHLAAFKAAYEKPLPWKPGTPRLIAALDANEVGETNISATESAQAALSNGTKYATLGTDLLRFRTQLDRGIKAITKNDPREMENDDYHNELKKGLKKPLMSAAPLDAHMPDRQKITQYPLEVLPDGNVLRLYWDPDVREVDVSYWSPRSADVYVGRRSVLV